MMPAVKKENSSHASKVRWDFSGTLDEKSAQTLEDAKMEIMTDGEKLFKLGMSDLHNSI